VFCGAEFVFAFFWTVYSASDCHFAAAFGTNTWMDGNSEAFEVEPEVGVHLGVDGLDHQIGIILGRNWQDLFTFLSRLFSGLIDTDGKEYALSIPHMVSLADTFRPTTIELSLCFDSILDTVAELSNISNFVSAIIVFPFLAIYADAAP